MSTQNNRRAGTLNQRFTQRLRVLLDQQGYPASIRDRSKALSIRLGVFESVASALLTGSEMPDYDVLMNLCELTGKNPGWFLDAGKETLPARTKLVRCVGPGEELAICLPKTLCEGRDDEPQALKYYRAVRAMGFGVKGGDFILTVDAELQPQALAKGDLYLVGSEHGYDIRRCVHTGGDRAALTTFDGKQVQTIRKHGLREVQADFQDSGLGNDLHHFGKIIAVLKGADNLPTTAEAWDLLV